MFNVVSTPDSSFSPPSTFLASELPTHHANTSLPPEEVVNIPNEMQTPPSSSRRTSTSTSISPLVFNLLQERQPEILKKLMQGTEINNCVRGAMDVLFTAGKMTKSNLEGKRKKRKIGRNTG